MKQFWKTVLMGSVLLAGISFLPAEAAEMSGLPVTESQNSEISPQFRSESLGFAVTMTANRMEGKENGSRTYSAYFPDSEMVMTVEMNPRRDFVSAEKIAADRKNLEDMVEDIMDKQNLSKAKLRHGKAGNLPAVIVDSESGEDWLTRYYIAGDDAFYIVVFSCRARDFKYNRKEMEAIMDTFEPFMPMQTISVPESSMTYKLPAGMAVSSGNLPSVHSVMALNRNMMSGVINKPLAESPYSFLPASLSGLTDAQKQEAEKNIREVLENDPSLTDVKNIAFTWGAFGAEPRDGVRVDYDQGSSHSENYIFVSDGQFISYAYIFDAAEKNRVQPVIDRSVSSIVW